MSGPSMAVAAKIAAPHGPAMNVASLPMRACVALALFSNPESANAACGTCWAKIVNALVPSRAAYRLAATGQPRTLGRAGGRKA